MEFLLRLLVAAGMAADAVVHWLFAPDMAGVQGGMIAGDDLFRGQAIVAVVAGVLNIVWARRWTYALSFLVASTALGAVLLYTFVDVGVLGPLPDMYDYVWYKEKTISAVGEGIATIAALIGIFVGGPERRSARGDS